MPALRPCRERGDDSSVCRSSSRLSQDSSEDRFDEEALDLEEGVGLWPLLKPPLALPPLIPLLPRPVILLLLLLLLFLLDEEAGAAPAARGNLKSSSSSGLVMMFTRSDVTSVACFQNPAAPIYTKPTRQK